jgi:hypothetical protein
MVDDFDGLEYELAAAVDAAQTPPFLTDHRIVVVRGFGRFTSDDVPPLVAYLGDPLPSTELVLVAGGGKVPKALADALKQAGAHVTDTAPPQKAKDRSSWIEQQVVAGGLRVDGGASNNNLLMQFQADILGVPVIRPKIVETTALGAAFLAGLSTGFWNGVSQIDRVWQADRQFLPAMAADEVARRRERWNEALSRARQWIDPAN